MAVMDTFMEAYNNGVLIHGNDKDLESYFEGVSPISYEEALENIYECQYSMEAICTMNENAIMMEAAGVATLTEGVVGAFFEAAIEKVKSFGEKVKQFAVACVKKIKEFFMELYAKATPIDKIMQQYGKNAVTHSEIMSAKANGMKIPGSLWLVTDAKVDASTIALDILEGKLSDNLHNSMGVIFDENILSNLKSVVKQDPKEG